MSITKTGQLVVLDETEGLQNGFTSVVAGDADDNDISTSRLPAAFSTRLTFYGLTLDEAALSGYGDGANAADDEGDNVVTVSADPGAEVTDLLLAANSDGDAFTSYAGGSMSSFSSGLFTVDGTEIYLFADPTDNNIAYGVAGSTASGDGTDIVFAVYLEEVENGDGNVTGAKLWTVLVDGYTLAHDIDGSSVADHDDSLDLTNKLYVAASSQADFSFAGAPPGSNLFMWFGDLDQAIVVTGRNPANQSEGENISSGDTVNTSGTATTALGTNGQQVKAGEGLYFTYVSGSTSTPNDDFIVPNLSQTEADVEANIAFADLVSAQGGAFTISQINPGNAKTTVSIKITAYTTDYEPGTGFVDGLGDADDVAVTITGVTINGVAAAFTVSGDGVIVSGVKTGDVVGFTTDGEHQRVLIENAQPTSGKGSNISFDLGGFSLLQVSTDTVEVGSNVQFEDDGPAIELTSLSPTIAVDESVGTGGSSKDEPGNAAPDDETAPGAPMGAIGYAVTAAAMLFSEIADAGEDGEAGKVYALVLNAGATGLTDTATGEAVVLVDNGGVIEGRTAITDALVFTIEVDGTTGEVTTTLYRALDHGADLNDHDSAVSMASGLVELEATLTDGDGDTASDKIELGSLIAFEDDGPAIDLTSLSPTIAVDESVGTGGSSKDEPGNAAPDDETAPGAPMGAIGYAVTAAAMLFSEIADAGEDGEAGKVYALVLNAGATGLTDTATGEAVVLVDNGGVIEGRTAITDALVFTIEVDGTTGEVTTTLYRALDHGADLNDHDSAVSMASGLVELEATLTDGDGDTASDKIELGSLIAFEDDGPDVTVNNSTGTYAAGAQGDWSDDAGSDGFGSLGVTFDSYEINAHGSVMTDAGNSTFMKTGDFTFEGSITDDFNGDGVDDTVEFTLTFDPDLDSYELLVTVPPETTTTFSTENGQLDAGGPDPVRTLTIDGFDVVFSAVDPTTPAGNITPFLNASEAFIEANAGYLSDDEMNVSTAGIGLANNNFDGNADSGIDGNVTKGGKVDESFVIDPEGDVSSVKVFIDNSVGGYDPGTEELYYLVYDADGNPVGTPTLVTAAHLTAEAGGQVSFVIGDPNGPNEIEAVQLFMGTGTIKIPVIEFTTSATFDPEPLHLDFTATLFDGDTDSSPDTFSVDLDLMA